ncbi:hypothetical protein [Evansella cellulosilytica]|uniref:Uncharacterized protein n=1 Tax=Evansella cellulosilytica (strain ATCC 21833 / DSM 2522 / FERM P-1141 / JCM 9156 / N-4) TaxID=649639 RepID=E6TW78_EVAC2|nr:hypothetical protein [Evansella cellulosilytica]ADU31034.1 hypothetical protein Bcell_2780 [Evansella cellulosilytica DSM 2522]
MFNRSFSVKRKAKKYRYWLEKVSVYPYPFEVSGRNYYLVDYIKMHRPVGTAVFSDEEEVVSDAKKAHRQLFLFYRLYEKIRDEGKMRAQVNLDFFRVPIAKMDEHQNKKWGEGYSFIKKLLGYQLTYKKAYEDFWANMRKIKDESSSLKEDDLELAINTAATLATVQLHVVHELVRNMDVLKNWKKAMDSAGIWTQLKREQQVFYIELMKKNELMEEEAKKIKSENFDRALKLNKEEMANYMKKEQKSDEGVLRYP